MSLLLVIPCIIGGAGKPFRKDKAHVRRMAEVYRDRRLALNPPPPAPVKVPKVVPSVVETPTETPAPIVPTERVERVTPAPRSPKRATVGTKVERPAKVAKVATVAPVRLYVNATDAEAARYAQILKDAADQRAAFKAASEGAR